MHKVATMIAGLWLAASCSSLGPSRIEKRSRDALDSCINVVQSLGIEPLSADVDRAYLYAFAGGAWLYFTHGDSGTFGERSPDYKVLLVCGLETGPPMEVVFMGRPLKDPFIDDPNREYFVSPQGSTEVLFKRVNGRLEYCYSQQFNETNIGSNNPGFNELEGKLGPILRQLPPTFKYDRERLEAFFESLPRNGADRH